MSRLLLALPLYQGLSRNAFLAYLALDKTPVVETIAVRKHYLARSMTEMCKAAIESETEWDRMVIYENDMSPPQDGLLRIAAYPDHLDIVGSVYWQKTSPYPPVVYSQTDENHFRALAENQIDEIMAKPGLYPVDAVGMGFTSIHRRVLEKWDLPEIPKQWQVPVGMWGDGYDLGHDMWFCRAARYQGFSVHVDSAISCIHLADGVPVSYENVKAFRTKTQETQEE